MSWGLWRAVVGDQRQQLEVMVWSCGVAVAVWLPVVVALPVPWAWPCGGRAVAVARPVGVLEALPEGLV